MQDVEARRGAGGHRVIATIAALWILAAVAFAVYRTTAMQLLTMPLFLAYLLACIAGVAVFVRDVRSRGWRAAVPLATCVAAWYSARFAAGIAHDLVFAHDLPAFEAIVARPEVKALAPGGEVVLELSPAEEDVVWWATAERTQDGTLLVEVLNGHGFPVKHSGYVYTSSGTIPADARMNHWPYRCDMKPHWLCVSD